MATRRQILTGGIGLATLLLAACGQAPASPAATSTPATAPAAAPTAPAAASPTTAASAAAQPTAQTAAQATNGAPVVPLIKISTGTLPFFKKALETFSQQHPEISIQPVYVNLDEYDPKTDLMVAAGNPPSLFYPAASRCYRYYATKDLILNLEPLIARDKFSLDDFTANSLAGCKWKGSLLSLPKSHSVWALFYNKKLFDNAKIAYPPTDWHDASWTWDKFRETAKALTIAQGSKVTQYGAGSDFGTGWTSGWSHGGWWFNKDWVDTGWITKFTAPDDPATIEAVQFWADLMNKDHYMPTTEETQGVQAGAPNLFMTGLVGMYLEYTGQLNLYAKITDFDWGIAPWPHGAKDQYPTHHGAWIDQWAIFKTTKNVEGSWLFLQFLVSKDGENLTDIQRGSPSSRKSMGQAWVDQWKSQLPKVDPKQLQVVTDALAIDWLTPDNWSVNFSPVDDKVLEPALQKVSLGQQSASDAINGVKPKVDQAIADSLKSMGYTG
jgi:multiple sugar transport system substrate-binding protein